MTTRKKTTQAPAPQEFTISAGMIKWAVGIIGGVLTVLVAWFAVWDRIDTHWRLESVASQKEKEQATHDKQVDLQIQSVAKRAEIGRAWVIYNVADGKAYTAAQFARICRALTLPADECARQDADALGFRQEATEAKRQAAEAGKVQ
jgi:hypothetical protein